MKENRNFPRLQNKPDIPDATSDFSRALEFAINIAAIASAVGDFAIDESFKYRGARQAGSRHYSVSLVAYSC